MIDNPINEVFDNSEWGTAKSDAETKILETVSCGGEEVILISDNDGEATEVSAEEATNGSEMEATKCENGNKA